MYQPVGPEGTSIRQILTGLAVGALVLALAAFIIAIIAVARVIPPATTPGVDAAALYVPDEAINFFSLYTGCIDTTPRFNATVSAYMSADNRSITIHVAADTTPFAMTLPGGCSNPINVGAIITLESTIPLPLAACTSALGVAAGATTLFMACVQTGNALSLAPLVNGSFVWTAGVTYAAPTTWTINYLVQ